MHPTSTVYVFRDAHLAPAGDTVAAAAALDFVVSIYGGGGLKGEEGLSTAFGGAAYFRNDASGDSFLGVWGRRNASRFQSRLRQAAIDLTILHQPPPARLTWYSTSDTRPHPNDPNRGD